MEPFSNMYFVITEDSDRDSRENRSQRRQKRIIQSRLRQLFTTHESSFVGN